MVMVILSDGDDNYNAGQGYVRDEDKGSCSFNDRSDGRYN